MFVERLEVCKANVHFMSKAAGVLINEYVFEERVSFCVFLINLRAYFGTLSGI